MEKKKIIIAGGSGTLGRLIASHFSNNNWNVIVLTRGGGSETNEITFVHWDGKTVENNWSKQLSGANAVLNLTGSSINVQFTEKNKKNILESRIFSTEAIGEVIAQCSTPPPVWLNASAVGIYEKNNTTHIETSKPSSDFIGTVCNEWEKTFFHSPTPNVRKVALRIGIMLTPTDGILEQLVPLTKIGLGGKAGKGDQYISWLHYQDLIRIIAFVIDNPNLHGPINCTAPKPVSNKEFMATLRHVLGIKIGIPTPTWAVKTGSLLLNTEADLVLKGCKAVPRILLDNNFRFNYSEITTSLSDLFTDNKTA